MLSATKLTIQINIRPLEKRDYDDWKVLYASYIAFQHQELTDEKRAILWQWLMERREEAFVAVVDGNVVGFAHYREMIHSLHACLTGFLDDLFVAENYRGTAVAYQLMDALKVEGKKRNWRFIRWYTADTNYRGKGFYDKIATKTPWETYQIDIK